MIDDSKSSLIQLKLRWLKVSFSMRQFVEMKTLVSGVFITPSSFKAILCWNISNLIMVRPWICREIVHEPEADAVSGLIKAHWKSLEGAFSNGMQTLSQSHWSFKLHPHPAWIQRPQTHSKQLVPTVQLLWSRRNCTNFYCSQSKLGLKTPHNNDRMTFCLQDNSAAMTKIFGNLESCWNGCC